jgi:uncharacterized protein YjbI with pentapeptide repeats
MLKNEVVENNFFRHVFSYDSLENTVYRKCRFTRADFVEATITNCDFFNCSLDSMDATSSLFVDCTFTDCLFISTSFSKSTFIHCTFQETESKEGVIHTNYHDYESKFERASFNQTSFLAGDNGPCSLVNIFMKSNNFRHSSLKKVVMVGSKFFGVSFHFTKWIECICDTIDLRRSACSYLVVRNCQVKTFIISASKLPELIGGADLILGAEQFLVVFGNEEEIEITEIDHELFDIYKNAIDQFFFISQFGPLKGVEISPQSPETHSSDSQYGPFF